MITIVFSTIVFFVATNIDDIFLLMAWFSQVKEAKQISYIVAGQYLGVILLLALSLIGAYGALLIPREWIGLLGLIPILIGIKSMYQIRKEHSNGFVWIIKTATVTFANGTDNISIYIPFFTGNSIWNIVLIVLISLALIAVWCYAGYLLVHQPFIAKTLERNGHIIVPFILIGMGIFILIKQETLHYIFTKF